MTIEVSAKKVQDAIKQGLEQLGTTLDNVDVEVLDNGGIFKKAKVRLTLTTESQDGSVATKLSEKTEKLEKTDKSDKSEKVEKGEKTEKIDKTAKPEKAKPELVRVKNETVEKTENNEKGKKGEKGEKSGNAQKRAEHKPDPKPMPKHEHTSAPRPVDAEAVAQAAEFVKELVAKMGFDGCTVATEGETVGITAPDGDDSLIIGRHGETLSAIAFLAETLARAEKKHLNIVADCNGYRGRREASLSAMARRRADECVQKHRKIKLEPMERIDRRTVHNALNDDTRVTTASEGKEPRRYVVIFPAK